MTCEARWRAVKVVPLRNRGRLLMGRVHVANATRKSVRCEKLRDVCENTAAVDRARSGDRCLLNSRRRNAQGWFRWGRKNSLGRGKSPPDCGNAGAPLSAAQRKMSAVSNSLSFRRVKLDLITGRVRGSAFVAQRLLRRPVSGWAGPVRHDVTCRISNVHVRQNQDGGRVRNHGSSQ